MRIEFLCHQKGSSVPYLNQAVFRLKDGSEIKVDREETEYSYEEDKERLEMAWNNCYIWNGKECDHDIDPEMFKGSVLKEIEIEDDAPEGYSCICCSCVIGMKRVSVRNPELCKKPNDTEV